MDKEIENKYYRELEYSLPIEYKGITLYPVKFRNINEYNAFAQCLLYDNVHYPDDRLSMLPRLYFITDFIKHLTDEVYVETNIQLKVKLLQLQGLLSLVLGEQKYSFQLSGENVNLRIYHLGNSEEFTDVKSKQFDTMRKIILAQNGTHYDDTFIHKDVLEWIAQQEAFEREHKHNNAYFTNEDKKEVLMLEYKATDETFADDMSIRRFNRLFDKLTNREIYNAQITGSMSGMVKFKEDPVNWIYTQPPKSILEKYFKAVKL